MGSGVAEPMTVAIAMPVPSEEGTLPQMGCWVPTGPSVLCPGSPSSHSSAAR